MNELAIVRWISDEESEELVRIQYCFTSLRRMAQACSAATRHDTLSKTLLRLMSRAPPPPLRWLPPGATSYRAPEYLSRAPWACRIVMRIGSTRSIDMHVSSKLTSRP